MKTSRIRLALLALACGTSLLHADYLVLKNGNKVEGNILSESPTSVRMKYRLTPKIWDEKDFPRTEIDQVVRQRPEEVEILELRKLLPTADLLTADRYEQIIHDRLRPFVNQYKDTPESKEAEQIIATLQDEKKKVSNGEVKLEGKWLNVTEAKGAEYNIEGYRLLTQMREHMAQNQWIEALRVFDNFSKKKPGYVGSTYYPAAIAEAMVCMDKWQAVLSKMALEQPAFAKAREEGLNKLPDTEKARTKAAIDEEVAKWQAQAEADRRAQVRWITPYKYDQASILNMQKAIVTERARLQATNLEELRQRSEAVSLVFRKIGEEDYTGGAAAYERLSALSNVADYRDVVADLRNRLMSLYQSLTRKQAAAQAAAAGSTAIGGSASTGQDERVAQILAQTSGQAPAAAGQAAAAAPMTAAPGQQAPAAAAPVQQAPVAATPGAAPVQQAPAAAAPVQQAPAAAPVQQAPVAPAPAYMPPQEEESGFQTYLIMGMGAVVLLLLVLLLRKKK